MAHKTIYNCIATLIDVSDETQLFFLVLWMILAVFGVVISIFFIKGLTRCSPSDKNKKPTKTVSRLKSQFICITVVCTCLIMLSLVSISIFGIFYVHWYHPVDNVDYITVCNNNNNDNTSETDLDELTVEDSYFYQLFVIIWIYLSIIFDINYVLILIVYYFRLIIIFDGSMFEISDYTKRFLILFIMVVTVLIILICTFILIGNVEGIHLSWLTFLGVYTLVGIYFIILLMKQTQLLVNMVRHTINMSHIKLEYDKSPTMSSEACASVDIKTSVHVNTTVKVKIGNTTNDNGLNKVMQIKQVSNRFAILTVFSLMFTMSVFIFYVLIVVFNLTVYDNTVTLIYITLLCCDNIVNVVCLFAQFEKFINVYNCLGCDKIENSIACFAVK